MSKIKKIFSLLSLILFIGAGPVVADGGLSAEESILLEEAEQSLDRRLGRGGVEDVMALPNYGEKGVIFVRVRSEAAKILVPDSWEGFPVWKQVGPITNLAFLIGPSQETIDYYTGRQEPATSSQTGQSTWTRQINPLVSSINLPPISFDMGALGNNKTLPSIQNIEIKSRMAEFSTPPIPKIPEFPAITQPQSYSTGMLTNNGGLLGTIPKLSLPQSFVVPTTK